MKKVFKVLRKTRYGLISANTSFTQVYTLGKINFPKIKGSKIFCFETFEQAKFFIRDEFQGFLGFGYLLIYECLADGVTECPSVIPQVDYSENTLTKAWDKFKIWKHIDSNSLIIDDIDCTVFARKVPEGSLLCDSLYLLNKVEFK